MYQASNELKVNPGLISHYMGKEMTVGETTYSVVKLQTNTVIYPSSFTLNRAQTSDTQIKRTLYPQAKESIKLPSAL